MVYERRTSGPKSTKKPTFSGFCTFLLSFSLHRVFSHWRPHRNLSPPPTDDCSASPRTQILTGNRGSHREVLLLPAADFLLLLLLLSSCSATCNQLQPSSSARPVTPPTTLQPSEPPSFPSSSSFTAWTVDVNYNSRPTVHIGHELYI